MKYNGKKYIKKELLPFFWCPGCGNGIIFAAMTRAMEENNLTDPKFVQKILMEKYKQRTQEMQQRNATLDEEGQEFHKTLPHVYDYSNIRNTQTIFDDMNKPRKFY